MAESITFLVLKSAPLGVVAGADFAALSKVGQGRALSSVDLALASAILPRTLGNAV